MHARVHRWSYVQDEIRQEEEEREVAEVEMLLGAYYMNLDSTLNKLTDISEFVEDAEVGSITSSHNRPACSAHCRWYMYVLLTEGAFKGWECLYSMVDQSLSLLRDRATIFVHGKDGHQLRDYIWQDLLQELMDLEMDTYRNNMIKVSLSE